MSKKVLFARVTPKAHAWAMRKVEMSKEKGMSASVVIERLLMNDFRKKIARTRKRRFESSADKN